MKKEYLIGGLLGFILCGIVIYAVVLFMNIQETETARQLAQQLPPPVPLEVTAPQQPSATVPLTDQAKSKKTIAAPMPADRQKMPAVQADASTAVMITLRNGRAIVADFCRDLRGKLVCTVSGGSMEIDRQEIASIRDVKLKSISSSDRADEPSDSTAEQKKPAEGASVAARGTQPKDGKTVRGLTAEQVQQLDAINERKTLLQPEREQLIKEREQLHTDVKNIGVMRSQEQFDAIKRRIGDLETKISGFNDEVNKMNDEERRLLEGVSQ